MKTDFLDAFFRHWDDAELLFKEQRWANASHLHGIAAECGLKRLMLCCNMPFDYANEKPAERDDRQHIDKIWLRYSTYQSGHLGQACLLSMNNPFVNWKVEQRYWHHENFTETQATDHRDGTVAVKRLLEEARRGGLL